MNSGGWRTTRASLRKPAQWQNRLSESPNFCYFPRTENMSTCVCARSRDRCKAFPVGTELVYGDETARLKLESVGDKDRRVTEGRRKARTWSGARLERSL